MNRSGLLALCAYNRYANRLMLETVERLTADELTRESSPSHGSVQQLLAHMLAAEASFLARCQERSLERLDLSTLADIRRHWGEVGRATEQFIASQADADFARELNSQLGGHPFHFPIWQLLTQAFMHSTHHRGELSILLTALGHPLPTLDIIVQFAEQSGQPWLLK